MNSLPHYHLDVLPAEIDRDDDPHRQLVAGFLAWLGVVQLDHWQAPTCFRLTPLGAALVGLLESAAPAPTGDAVSATPPPAWRPAAHQSEAILLAVNPASPPALIYSLAAAAPVVWAGPGSARLTPASLAGADHREVADLVHLLDAGLARPLTSDAIRTLHGWAREGSRLAIHQVTLLETDDPDLLARLAGRRGIRRHLGRAYGRRAVGVESNTLESLLRKLRRLGLAPEVTVALDPRDRPAAGRRWGPEDSGHLLLAAKIYNQLPGRASLGSTRHRFRPTHYIPEATLERLAQGLSPRILEAVEQMAEDALQRMHNAIDGWRFPPPAAEDRLHGPALDALLDTLRQALANGFAVEIEYYTAGRGELTQRTVEPLRLEDRDGAAYLVAYCRLRRAERVFRVDRIRAATPVTGS